MQNRGKEEIKDKERQVREDEGVKGGENKKRASVFSGFL